MLVAIFEAPWPASLPSPEPLAEDLVELLSVGSSTSFPLVLATALTDEETTSPKPFEKLISDLSTADDVAVRGSHRSFSMIVGFAWLLHVASC